MDNCPIHKQRRIADAVHQRQAILLFLEPYDPDSMPVEYAFKVMKNWMRKWGRTLTKQNLGVDAQCRMASRAVTTKEARHAFHAAGYI